MTRMFLGSIVTTAICAIVCLGTVQKPTDAVAEVPPDVGVLQYIEVSSPHEALRHQPAHVYQPKAFAKPSEGDGTVHRKAKIASIQMGGQTVKLAIDAQDPGDKKPNVVRIDLSGQGQFAAAPTAPLQVHQGSKQSMHASIGPGTFWIERDGQQIPVSVSGNYYEYRHGRGARGRNLSLSITTAAEGRCQFGDRALRVRIIDGNSNLKIDDAAKTGQGMPFARQVQGDTVVVYDGVKPDAGQLLKSFVGQPVQIEGRWYELAVAPDTLMIKAAPVDIEAGQIQFAHEHWSALLIGKEHVFDLRGGAEPIDLPADRYAVAGFTQQGEPNDQGRRATLMVSGPRMRGGNTIDVLADQTVPVDCGAPLTARVGANQKGRMVQLSLDLRDAGGRKVQSIMLANGGRPPEPRIKILNADGEQVHTGKMEYG